MRIVVDRKQLADAVKTLAKVQPEARLFPVRAVKLTLRAEELKLYATNFDQSLSLTIHPISSEGTGEFAIRASEFANVVAKLPEAQVELAHDDADPTTVVLACGPSRAKLIAIADYDAGSLDIGKDAASFAVKSADLRRIIQRTEHAMADDPGRPFMCGLRFDQDEDGRLTVAATDGNRLAVTTGTVMVAGPPVHATVPREAIELLDLLLDEESLVKCLFGDRGASFLTESWELRTRLLEGMYPNYRAVIPQQEPPLRVTIERERLLEAVKRAQIVAGNIGPAVILQIADGKITVSARQAEVGEYTEEIAAQTEGDDLEIAFQPQYLRDALEAAAGERVTMGFNGPLAAATVRDLNDDSWLALLMPLRRPDR